ncbi:hypothetical protein [Nostoc sp. MS1]|uniref:hypothetical protein n=1 Tax=Nostoc sp. MS1 TaxID=2764711 RepID=UPI001CC4A06C|nr:hypothetical protein [Nostoc sp. MS1]BCL36577.1 hypothetical protein NSMS1_30240 [Nostoc sp. MS1]
MQLLEQTTVKTFEQSNNNVNSSSKSRPQLTMIWVEECNEGNCKLTAKWVVE